MRGIIFAACLAICLAATGCGSIAKQDAGTSSDVTTEATTGDVTTTETTLATTAATKPETTTGATSATTAKTESATETTAAATTEAATQTATEALAEPTTAGSSETETQTGAIQAGPSTEQAQELVRALDTLERLVGCGLQNDADSVWTVNGTAYHKVTDDCFVDTAAIRAYEEKYLTQDIIAERYTAILGGDAPIYLDADDGLYMKDSAKGFYIFSDTGMTVEKTSEEGYSILAGYDNYGATETADIRIVNANGTWKICGLSLGL